MPITIITVGKRHDPQLIDAINSYHKRLTKPFDTKWELLSHSAKDGAEAREDESQRIIKRLTERQFTILLDERGTLLDSPTIAKQLVDVFELSRPIVIIIGGAYGVNDTLRKKADLVWSLSPLVFPHQLVRLVLIEQLYRASTLYRGTPYHND